VLGVVFSLLVAAAPLESDPAFRAARARYDDFEFADARDRFEALLKRKLDPQTRARVLVWIGMCDAEEGALADAAASFDDAARLDLDVEPLPTMSPKARRMLDEARRRARAALATPARGRDGAADDDAADDAADGDVRDGVRDDDAAPVVSNPASSPSPLVVVGGVAAGTGVVSVAGGIALGVLASTAASDAALDGDAAAASRRYADATNLALGANVAWVAGAVAGAVGAVCIVVGLSDAGAAEP
jgi:hypothetical protein